MLAFALTGCKEDSESETLRLPRSGVYSLSINIDTASFSGSSGNTDKNVINIIKEQGEDKKNARFITINFDNEQTTEKVQFGNSDLSENGILLLHDLEAPENITSPANVTIDGHGAAIDLTGGNENSAPLITVGKGVTLTLRNITFKGLAAKTPTDPAEISPYRIYGDDDTSDNSAPVILVKDGGTLIMGSGAKITENHNAMHSSGGVHIEGGILTMKHGSEIHNVSGGFGGVQASGTFRMDGGKISNNKSSTDGGGVFFKDGSFHIQDGEISGNIAKEEGGGIYMADGKFEMNGGTISNNEAHGDGGGGVFLQSSIFFMTGGDIKGNSLQNENGKGAGVAINDDKGFLKIGGTIYGMKTADDENEESDKQNYVMPKNDFREGKGYAVYKKGEGNEDRYLDKTSTATTTKLDSSKDEGWD
jgi:hypothetical protein